jgi:hypothetical protein
MRRAPALFVVVGVVAGLSGLSAEAKPAAPVEGFWVTLASGSGSSSSPSGYNEFWFDSPHAPPVSVSQATGIGNIQATTSGGNTTFTSAGTPILVPTTDGYATISSGSTIPSSALPRFAGGSMASGAPQGGGSIPSSADLMSLNLSSPGANGSQTLSVSMTTPGGTKLGQTSVTVPGNGWWVVGLGAGLSSNTNPIGGPTPIPVPTGPGPVTNPSPGSGTGGNHGTTAATPEPASFLLLGIGGLTAAGWRRWRK